MSIDLQDFGYGDLDYIVKLNANMSAIEAAINSLQAAASSGGSLDTGKFYEVLFGGQTTLIGITSYVPTGVSATLTVSGGGAYRSTSLTVVSFLAPTDLDFTGESAGTYYVDIDSAGLPSKNDTLTEWSVYSVGWTGAAFGTITRIAQAMFVADEEDDGRSTFANLDARLDGLVPTSYLDTDGTLAADSDSKIATQKATKTYVDAAIVGGSGITTLTGDVTAGPGSGSVASTVATHAVTNAKMATMVQATVKGRAAAAGTGDPTDLTPDQLSTILDGASDPFIRTSAGAGGIVRKYGVTIDGAGSVLSTGIKGAIQVDKAGTIIGWSIIADQVGSISVEVDKVASSAPPSAPGIPNTTTDKISASAPIALSSAQSAAGGTSAVSTWTTAVSQWDVLQFNVASVTTMTRCTLYIRLQE